MFKYRFFFLFVFVANYLLRCFTCIILQMGRPPKGKTDDDDNWNPTEEELFARLVCSRKELYDKEYRNKKEEKKTALHKVAQQVNKSCEYYS